MNLIARENFADFLRKIYGEESQKNGSGRFNKNVRPDNLIIQFNSYSYLRKIGRGVSNYVGLKLNLF